MAEPQRQTIPKITYIPIHDGDPHKTVWNRQMFEARVPTTPKDVKGGLSALEMIEAAKNNAWFSVEGHKRASTTPAVPETEEQYKLYAQAWIRNAGSSKEMKDRWKAETELRRECGVGDDTLDFLRSISDPKLAELQNSERIHAQSVDG